MVRTVGMDPVDPEVIDKDEDHIGTIECAWSGAENGGQACEKQRKCGQGKPAYCGYKGEGGTHGRTDGRMPLDRKRLSTETFE